MIIRSKELSIFFEEWANVENLRCFAMSPQQTFTEVRLVMRNGTASLCKTLLHPLFHHNSQSVRNVSKKYDSRYIVRYTNSAAEREAKSGVSILKLSGLCTYICTYPSLLGHLKLKLVTEI